jgi:hypothetical protein
MKHYIAYTVLISIISFQTVTIVILDSADTTAKDYQWIITEVIKDRDSWCGRNYHIMKSN